MKRAVFKNRRLPYLLVLPQLAVTLAFFFWPAFESLRLSFFRTSPFANNAERLAAPSGVLAKRTTPLVGVSRR